MADAPQNPTEPKNQDPTPPKTFTQEEVNELMGKVRREVTGKFTDYDELKKKANEFDALQESQKSELEKAQERAAKAEQEAKALREQKEHADLIAKVSAATGVPATLISGSNEDEMTASAQALAEWAKATSTVAPVDKGGAAAPKPQTETSIREMKSPIDRINAYAQEYEK